MTALVREMSVRACRDASRPAEADASPTPAVPPGLRPDPNSDARFTYGLIYDVFNILESHGYRCGEHRHIGQAVGLLVRLTRVFEGTGEAS